MARISDEIKQLVLDKTDIVELIGGYLQLKRAGGGGFVGLCPFHDEKSPSFNVNPQRQFYHCFGCKESGDAISFVRKYENLEFTDALKKLADRVGVTVREEALDPEQIKKFKMRGQLLEIHREATLWFQSMLSKSRGSDAERARQYLKGRGINGEMARRWQIGFAPADGRDFEYWAKSKGYSGRAMVNSGLMALRDENDPNRGLYSRFRDRVMFPVANDYGEVIAFSGRILDPESKLAKYMNSPETIIFEKKKTFFGLDKSKKLILKSETAVVCEGQLDMIMCFEAGIENIVAPLGTAFTSDHARMLKRIAEEVVLVYDADEAGFKAAVRTFGELSSTGAVVKAVDMPKGHDPDTLLKAEGVEAFKNRLANAKMFHEFQIDHMSGLLDLTNVRDKVKFANELATTVAKIPDRVHQDMVVHSVSTRLGVPVDDFRKRVANFARAIEKGDMRKQRREESVDGREAPLVVKDKDIAMLCKLALTSEAVRKWFVENKDKQFLLNSVPDSEILSKVWEGEYDVTSSSSMNSYLSELSEREEGCLRGLILVPSPGSGVQDAKRAFKRLEIRSVEQRMQIAQGALSAPNITSENIIKITTQMSAMRKELLDLKKELHDIAASTGLDSP
jgi:DNA primase